MGTLTRIFLRGLVAVLPLALTIAIVYWLGQSSEKLFRGLVEFIGLGDYYWTGMGIAMAVVLTCVIGLLSYNPLLRWLYGLGTSLLERIPMVKTIYGMLRDMTSFFADSKKRFNKVVVVQPVGEGPELLGFVTRDDLTGLPAELGGSERVAVYMPLSYAFGGFTVLVPKNHVRYVDHQVLQRPA